MLGRSLKKGQPLIGLVLWSVGFWGWCLDRVALPEALNPKPLKFEDFVSWVSGWTSLGGYVLELDGLCVRLLGFSVQGVHFCGLSV